ncbi:MAG TPA: cobalamin-binding protein [Gemmatimonadales bacterium]|nr:cobalamin-binding protein [Gemmatimonadales bacterium]
MLIRRRDEAAAEGARIVSLLPSATEIVCALGLEERLVGISHSCDYPDSIVDRPRLSRPRTDLDGLSSGQIDAAVRAAFRDYGSVYEIDVAAIRALNPDLILTQGICDVCAVPKSQVIDASLGARVLTLDAHDVAAIFSSIRDVGCATGAAEQAEALIASMEARIADVRARVDGCERPRVLALEWLDPPYVPGHWVPELIEAAGGELVAGTARRPSYPVEWSDLRALKADVVLIMPCGFGLENTQREAERYESELRTLGGRIHCLDAAAYFSRSGPRIVDGVEIIASVLYPG